MQLMKKYTFLLLSSLGLFSSLQAQVQNEESNSIERHRIWISASNEEGVYHETLIGYVTGATMGIDPAYDGHLLGGNQIKIYSLIEEGKFAIQARPLPFNVQDVVKIGIQVQADQLVTLSLNRKDGIFDQQSVYLHDNATNTCHNLTEGAVTIALEDGIYNERFTVVYQSEQLQTGTWQEQAAIQMAVKPQVGISVQTQQPIQSIELYTVDMKRIQNWKGYEQTLWETNQLALATGVYLLRVHLTDGTSHAKRIVY